MYVDIYLSCPFSVITENNDLVMLVLNLVYIDLSSVLLYL